jgi:hypothetical protein
MHARVAALPPVMAWRVARAGDHGRRSWSVSGGARRRRRSCGRGRRGRLWRSRRGTPDSSWSARYAIRHSAAARAQRRRLASCATPTNPASLPFTGTRKCMLVRMAAVPERGQDSDKHCVLEDLATLSCPASRLQDPRRAPTWRSSCRNRCPDQTRPVRSRSPLPPEEERASGLRMRVLLQRFEG